MLKALRLHVHLVTLESESLGQVKFEQAMMADHFRGDALPQICEFHTSVRLVVDQLKLGQTLEHVGSRGGGDRDSLGQRLSGYPTRPFLQAKNSLEIVLH